MLNPRNKYQLNRSKFPINNCAQKYFCWEEKLNKCSHWTPYLLVAEPLVIACIRLKSFHNKLNLFQCWFSYNFTEMIKILRTFLIKLKAAILSGNDKMKSQKLSLKGDRGKTKLSSLLVIWKKVDKIMFVCVFISSFQLIF